MSTWIDWKLPHGRASATTVAMFRIWLFGLCAVRVASSTEAMRSLPPETFGSYGFFTLLPAEWVQAVTTGQGLLVLQYGAIALCLLAAVGVFPRFTTVAATVAFTLFEGTIRGYMGWVNHAQLPLLLACTAVAVSPNDHALTVVPRRPADPTPARYQFALVSILAMFCIGYAFISGHRLAYGGLTLFSSNSLPEWILYHSLGQPAPLETPGGWVVSHPLAATVVRFSFPFITLLEVSAPLCLVSSRFRRFFIPAMLSVHLGIYVLMRINFYELALLYVVFIDSSRWSPTFSSGGKTVVFFDGVCGLCNRFVDFLIRRDRADVLRFAPLQGETAAEVLAPDLAADLSTLAVVEGDDTLVRSQGALAAIGRLPGLWPLVSVFGLVPRPLSDWVYDRVADGRYERFGKLPACRLPEPNEAEAFLP